MVVFGMLSPVSLLLLVTLIPVQKNINLFLKSRATTFITSIKNYVIIMATDCLLIL